MPAITVDKTSTLPRIARRRPAAVTPGPVRHRRAERVRRRGLPGPTCIRRRRPLGARPVRPPRPDRRGRLRPRRTEGHALAPPSRVRDGHLHDGGRHPARRLHWRWRRHPRRRHAVDDRWQRHPAHRDTAADVVAAGGLFHGLQLWVNLPRAKKLIDPRYQDLGADRVTLVTTPNADVVLRIIAGDVGSFSGPGATHTPMTMVHATLAPGASAAIPWPAEFNCLVYVLGGRRRDRSRSHPDRDRLPDGARRRRPVHRRGAHDDRTRAPAPWRCCCSAGNRSASRWRGTARS